MQIKIIIGAGLFSMSFAAQSAQATDWSGIYAGGHAGYSFFSTEHKQLEVSNFAAQPTTINEYSNEPSGFSGGVHAGYQMHLGDFVLGVEGTYTLLDIDDFGRTELNNGTSTATAEISDIFGVAARGGFALDNVLAYGKIGYANAGFGYDNVLNATGASLLSTEERESGLLLGAGAEFAITDNVSVGVDYTYINFDIDTRIQELDAASLRPTIEEKIDSDHHQLNVRLNFRLN